MMKTYPWQRVHKTDPTMTHHEVAETLEQFVEGRGGQWDWDNYMSATFFSDPYLKSVQQRMVQLSDEFPPPLGMGFCSAEGKQVIRNYIEELRAKGRVAHI